VTTSRWSRYPATISGRIKLGVAMAVTIGAELIHDADVRADAFPVRGPVRLVVGHENAAV
jgi:hypothetical protein